MMLMHSSRALASARRIKEVLDEKSKGFTFMINDTPIFDIKPYLPYTDCHNDASNGFALDNTGGLLDVKCSDEILSKIPFDMVDGLFETLTHDPRPSYQNDDRIYGMSYGDYQVKFTVNKNELKIIDII